MKKEISFVLLVGVLVLIAMVSCSNSIAGDYYDAINARHELPEGVSIVYSSVDAKEKGGWIENYLQEVFDETPVIVQKVKHLDNSRQIVAPHTHVWWDTGEYLYVKRVTVTGVWIYKYELVICRVECPNPCSASKLKFIGVEFEPNPDIPVLTPLSTGGDQ